jgi:hypothetical protein
VPAESRALAPGAVLGLLGFRKGSGAAGDAAATGGRGLSSAATRKALELDAARTIGGETLHQVALAGGGLVVVVVDPVALNGGDAGTVEKRKSVNLSFSQRNGARAREQATR